MKTYQLTVTQADFATMMFGLAVAINDIGENIIGMTHSSQDHSDLINAQHEHVEMLKALKLQLMKQYSQQDTTK